MDQIHVTSKLFIELPGRPRRAELKLETHPGLSSIEDCFRSRDYSAATQKFIQPLVT
jgi:hypothetical protein